jgi:GNAT superfamily N-acetyltransferase
MAMTVGVPALPLRWVAARDPSSVSRDDPGGWYRHALAVDSASSGKHVIRLAVSHLSASERDALRTLTPDGEIRSEADADVASAMTWSVMAKPDQRVVSQTGILYRVIRVGDVLLPVGGLSNVMTLPETRGRGYARAVVASATAFVGVWLWAPFAVVLCAADATGFYERLGWRKVNERVSCKRSGGQQALTNRLAMVLPCQGEAEWPSGPIDLCGAPW